jgi:hypothetical protein
LTDLERTLLVLCGAGVSGWHLGIAHTASGDKESGCNYPVRLTGRIAASAAGIESSELIVTDDAGTFISRLRDLDPTRLQELQTTDDIEGLLTHVREHCVPLTADRLQLSATTPHMDAHNFWNANRPGTTLFIPIVDLTQQLLDILAMQLAAGAVPWDPLHNRSCGDLQPFLRSGLLQDEKRSSIVEIEQSTLTTGAIELALICQNIVLVMQAMVLGGWMFTGLNAPSVLGAFADEGVPGLGFRFTHDPSWGAPNPVGRDGVYEGFCPPYTADMREAVERFVALKFGPGGTYDPARPGPFRDNARIKAAIERYSPEFIAALAEVAQYLHDTFGKFPATIPSVYVRMYAQAQHIDLDFYDRFYGADSYLETHREHLARWHPQQGVRGNTS